MQLIEGQMCVFLFLIKRQKRSNKLRIESARQGKASLFV